MANIREFMEAAPVIPVLVVQEIEQAVPLAEALVAGGLPCLEVTLRTPCALDAIRAMAKVPAAIHCTPEALSHGDENPGPIAYLRDGDIVRVDAVNGRLSTTADLSSREPAPPPPPALGVGRELFAMMRLGADEAEKGGSAMLALAGL